MDHPTGIHKGLEKHENIVHKDDEMAETVPAEDVQTNPFADDMEDGGNEEEEIAEEDQEQSEEEKLPTLQHLEETLLSKFDENRQIQPVTPWNEGVGARWGRTSVM